MGTFIQLIGFNQKNNKQRLCCLVAQPGCSGFDMHNFFVF